MSTKDKSQKRKHKKNYYMQSAKKQKTGILQVGMKGILITCNNFEKQSVKEAYNLLNEYADKLFGPELQIQEINNSENNTEFEKQLSQELQALKEIKHCRRFQQVNTKVKNVLFIQAKVPDPIKLVSSIFEDIKKSGERKTRYIMRMIPIIVTCKPFLDNLKKSINELMEEYSKNETTNDASTYKIICKIRHNNDAPRDHIIWYGREAVQKFMPTWTATIVDPEVVIAVEVVQSVCCLTVLKNYMEYKKYNLAEIVPNECKSAHVRKGKFFRKENSNAQEPSFNENTTDKFESDQPFQKVCENLDISQEKLKLENAEIKTLELSTDNSHVEHSAQNCASDELGEIDLFSNVARK